VTTDSGTGVVTASTAGRTVFVSTASSAGQPVAAAADTSALAFTGSESTGGLAAGLLALLADDLRTRIEAGTPVTKPVPVFTKLDPAVVDEELDRLAKP